MDMIDQLRAAADALNEGNPEPFAALMADDSEWRGVSNGRLWWKQTPACHGPNEALDVMQHQLRKRADNRLQVRPDFTQVGEGKAFAAQRGLIGHGIGLLPLTILRMPSRQRLVTLASAASV